LPEKHTDALFKILAGKHELLLLAGNVYFQGNLLEPACALQGAAAAAVVRGTAPSGRWDPALWGGACLLSAGALEGAGQGLHALLDRLARQDALRVLDRGGLVRAGAALDDPDLGRRPAAFFDRDGVLNQDHGYVHRTEDFHWMAGAKEAVRRCNDLGLLVIVLTNQSGIGRGYYGEAEFLRLCRWMDRELAALCAHIDGFFFCPHHPTAGQGAYRTECECRKPAPGLIDQALAAWDVDQGASFLVGDSPRDLEAARARNLRNALYEGGDLLEFLHTRGLLPRDG
jgi:D-glycero-D-manno-heptose 1,7-bisphosphate phosphatase